MYPERYQLPALTAHVVGLLERRRAGVKAWSAETEAHLREDSKGALAEAGRQFAEVADDPGYWKRTSAAVLEVALPRYLKLAQAETAQEQLGYGLWRGGDLLSRVAYGAAGLATALVLWRTGLPRIIEPLPLALFIGGPLLPDLWTWRARRRYQKALQAVVDDMVHEQAQLDTYRPLSDHSASSIDEGPQSSQSTGAAARLTEKP